MEKIISELSFIGLLLLLLFIKIHCGTIEIKIKEMNSTIPVQTEK